jgi:hypothetical protein
MGILKTLLRRGPKLDRDAAALTVLRRRGIDLSRPVALRHFLYFVREYEALVVAADLRASGFETETTILPLDAGLLVLARREDVLSDTSVRGLRERMEQAALSQKGEYDGWEAEGPAGNVVAVARRNS